MKSATICPRCRTRNADTGANARSAGAILGGLSGATLIILRIVDRAPAAFSVPLLAVALIGLLWNVNAGQFIGARTDETFPHKIRCRICGSEFEV